MPGKGVFRFRRIVGFAAVAAFLTLLVGQAPAGNQDNQRPTSPQNLVASSSTKLAITLSWQASKDNLHVTGYRVYRNGTFVASATNLKYTLTGLRCGTIYIVFVVARDAAGNFSLPTAIFARTSECSPPPPPPSPPPVVCPTPANVFALILEHKLSYGSCEWPDGWAAREALRSIRGFLAGRDAQLDTWRAHKWMKVVLSELDAAEANNAAWTAQGALKGNTAGLSVLTAIGRAIRLLHWANPQLFTVSKSEKWALAALTWYSSASAFKAKADSLSPDLKASIQHDLDRAEADFFSSNCYRAWGRYRTAWRRVYGL